MWLTLQTSGSQYNAIVKHNNINWGKLKMKTQTMKGILTVLEKGVETGEVKTFHGQMRNNYKADLIEEIENEFITDVVKAENWLELIELVYEWAMDATFDYEHRLFFNEGIVELDSISEYCGGDWVLDYKDGQLLIDGEEFGESVLHLLSHIESCL